MMQQMYSVILAERAEEMLLSHTEFLAQVRGSGAYRLIEDFKKAADMLAGNPFQFPFADEMDVPGIPVETYRKCLFGWRYKALYLVEDDQVYIDAIVDGRQENKGLY
ncbi:MAG: type II toxin-antitoxin system RelE/ParE family toxin [Spirochaetaceae bacterium]|jgi:plasmid stabilization system protein ParE|nr:type II toxin-antitoxin system RelE/ParE family toxin [Spirochaetaceae bacterium]